MIPKTQFVKQSAFKIYTVPTVQSPVPKILSLSVDPTLPFRKIYAYAAVVPFNISTVLDFGIFCTVKLIRNNSVESEFPLAAINFTSIAMMDRLTGVNGSESMWTNPIPASLDSILVSLGGFYTLSEKQVLLSPFRMVGAADEIQVDITKYLGFDNISADENRIYYWKLYLACVSSNAPF